MFSQHFQQRAVSLNMTTNTFEKRRVNSFRLKTSQQQRKQNEKANDENTKRIKKLRKDFENFDDFDDFELCEINC